MAKSTKEKTDYTSKTEEEACAKKKALLLGSTLFMDKEFKKNAIRYRKMFKGDHWGGLGRNIDKTQNDLVVVNYVYSILKSVIPQTYYQDPYFDVYVNDPMSMGKMFTPETLKLQLPDGSMPILDELLKREQLTEDALNEKWGQLKIKQTMKRIQLDQLVMGFGAGKLGWSTQTKKDYDKPNMETGQEYTELVTEDDAFFLRVSTQDILFDTSAKHFDEMRWMATRYFLPIEMVRERFNFEGGFNPVTVVDQKLINKFNQTDRQAFEMAEIWEFQDLGEDKFFYMTDGYDKYLNVVDNQYNIGFNTKIFAVNDCPDELLPISDVSQIEDLNMELNKTRTQMLNHRRKLQRKILAESDAFKTQEEFNRFMNDDDMQVCEVKSGALSSNKVLIVQPGILPPDFYHIDEINKDDIYQVSGTGANQLAAEGLVSKTATEANIIEKNANLRNKERVDKLDDYCEELARDLLSIMQKFPKKSTFRQRDKQIWVQHDEKDIKGDFSVAIKIGSMQRPNDQLQTEILMNVLPKFLEMKKVNPDGTEVPYFNPEEVFKATMKKTGFTETEIMKMMETSTPTAPPAPPPQQGGGQGGMGGQDALANMLMQ
jgi:hypothetical protein